jgi:aspartate/methionine/tyrosine aminotransferase
LKEFRLESYFARWEFKARYNLAASDAQTCSVTRLLETADPSDRERWRELNLGYIPSEGTPELRQAIAASYETVAPDDVLCFAGAQEGLYCAMHALLQPGDHAIVLVPNYQSMESVPRTLCDVDGVALRPENGWKLDPAEVRAAFRRNTKLVAVNFPNNPTGMNCDAATFEALIGMCRERGVHLFSDEVYRGIERNEAKRLPQAADRYERALSLNVVSKAYGLPGLRVGWIACRDRALLAAMQNVKHYLSICNAAPAELLATIALKAREALLGRNRRLCAKNLAALRSFFAGHAGRFEWYEPDGGCISFPRYCGSEGVETFCERLLSQAGVLLVPASIFRSDLLAVPADRFRIGYGRPCIGEALAAFSAFLA